ncbi:amidohydrolase 2 [Pholiota conissans]|uniref:Amidohydrolase 2 n=1 Tax=Pholiota conissans TaxID=109636 RepID=A0A9P6CYH8_9AGAR|nr:amidohydrolase 2 [Pholiota conissans]
MFTPRAILFNEHIRCIDVHHHYFPLDLDKENSNVNVGFKTPAENLPWFPEISMRAMDTMHIDFSILSFPAISNGCVSQENRAITRGRNEFAADVCRRYPHKFGFFTTLPFLDDIEGSIAEAIYGLDSLTAYGVSISSCYGVGPAAKYIGDECYYPIWAELNKRKAVVFLHGSQVPSSTPYPHPFLGIPITEVPNETFKAAAHLVVTGHRRKFPNVKIILAHLGGSAPFLATRAAVLSNYMGCTLTPEEILTDFKSFYYETALSASELTLTAMKTFAQEDRILFGTDFPAVSKDTVSCFTKNIEKYYENDNKRLESIMGGNAKMMFLASIGAE